MVRMTSDVGVAILGATAVLAALVMAVVSRPVRTPALRSPENLAASKRMTEYCGLKAATAK